MKIYVAGKWQDKFTVRGVHQYLRERGHEITLDWTNHDFGPKGVLGTPQHLRDISIEDLEGVEAAELVVGIVLSEYVYKGLWVEVGAALAHRKRVILVGHYGDSCIFANHPLVTTCSTIADMLNLLDAMAVTGAQV